MTARVAAERIWETRLLGMIVAGLVVVGLAAVYSASSLVATPSGVVGNAYAVRQAVGAVIGGILATILARVDYARWRQWAWPLIAVTAVLLLLPLLPFTHSIAPTINGARRWVSIGPVQLQPSEIAKLAIVVWVAMLAAKKGDLIRSFRRGPAPVLVVLAPIVLLIFLQPNLSMAILVGMLGGVVLFAAGARIGHFLLLGALAAPILYRAVADAQYRLARVLTFLNPGNAPTEASWQVKQSLIGIGAGGFVGVGYGQGQQKLGYLPYAYSDFVLSSIGEEWGFVGLALITAAFAVILWLGFRIAQSAPDLFGRLLATGLTALIGMSALLHIGVSLAVIPATGIPLPFISYGRSSLIVSLAAIGILVSVGNARGRKPDS